MKTRYTVILSMCAGAAIGASAIQGINAQQGRPCAFNHAPSRATAPSRLFAPATGTLPQRTQCKPAMVILTELRVTMPAARRPEATEEATPLLRPADPDAEPGRGRYADAY